VFDLETGEFFVSRDVVFHENVFPFEPRGKEEPLVESGINPSSEDTGPGFTSQGSIDNPMGRDIMMA